MKLLLLLLSNKNAIGVEVVRIRDVISEKRICNMLAIRFEHRFRCLKNYFFLTKSIMHYLSDAMKAFFFK